MNHPIQIYRGDETAQQEMVLSGQRPEGARGERIDLNSLLATLRRRLPLFLTVSIGIFAVGVVLMLRATPVYTATATVVIDTHAVQLTPTNEQILRDGGNNLTVAAIDTEVAVITSTEMADKVADALKLDEAPAFATPRALPSRSWWGRITGAEPPALPARAYDTRAQRSYVVRRLESGLKVERTGNTYALSISYTSPIPSFSAQIANAYAQQYIDSALHRKRKATTGAMEFLSKRIGELRDQANADTQAVQQYRISHNLLSSSASQLTEQEVSTYNQQLAAARTAAAQDRARLETAQQQLRSGSKGDDVGEALDSGVVGSLKTQRAGLAAEFANLRARYGPRHPDVLRTQQQLADLDVSIQSEINRVISNLKAKTNVSAAQLGAVEGSLSGAKGTLASSNRALVGFDDLTRKAAASQASYQAYLDRYTQITAQEGTEQADARIVSLAEPPGAPSSPNIPLSLFLSVALGLGGGLGAAFLVEVAFRGMTTGEDAETRLGVPSLGTVPLLKSVMKWAGDPVDSLAERPQSAFAESFRNLQTSINFAVDAVVQVVVITSALPREGKSTVAAGLARVTAVDGQRVLLVDCDLRRRSVNRLIKEPPVAGLIEVLRGEATLDQAIVQDEQSGCWLLPLNSGRIGPGDYFAGEPMRNLLKELRAEFTYIILDTAPVLPVADTRLLATLADATVFVTRWRKTPDDAVRSALRLLPRGRINLAGVVLSQVDLRRPRRFGHGDSSYYYNQYKDYYV